LKLLFAGTPQVAAHYLDFLHQNHEIMLVVTQSVKASGRGLKPSESAVASYAKTNNLELVETSNINSKEIIEKIETSGAELGVVVAFGQIIKAETRKALPKEFINLHFSKLPKLRGADPVAAAVRLGMGETGVSVFKLNDELDAGEIYSQFSVEVTESDTTADLFNKLLPLGEQGLNVALELINRDLAPVPQVGKVSYAPKTSNNDLKIRWNLKGSEIRNLVRSGYEKKSAWTVYQGQVVKIIDIKTTDVSNFGKIGEMFIDDSVYVQTLDEVLEIREVIPAGRNLMKAADWGRGLRVTKGLFE
jgi:methionyl-tRNA formyltransferase